MPPNIAELRAEPAVAPERVAASGAPLSDTARRWIETTTGARVTDARRFARARDTWWIDTEHPRDGGRQWLLKGRRAPAAVMARSRLLTDFGVAREAAAMSALAGSGVRVPAVGGFDAESSLLLIERLPGSALVHRAPLHERRAAVIDYGRQLARLHSLSVPRELGPAIAIPSSAREMALGGWLSSAEVDARTAAPRLRHAEPLLTLLVGWLHDRVPAHRGPEHLRLLHGDAGVTNFLSLDGRVTALLDWELAIVGDPMSDLGNARYREALYPSGTYADLIESYEQATETRIDESTVGYYTVLASVVLSLGMVANTHNPRARQPEAVARLWQDALARCIACEAACEVDGVPLPYDDMTPFDKTADAITSSLHDPLVDLLVDREGAAVASDPSARGYRRLAMAVGNAVRSGVAVDAALVSETSALVGADQLDAPGALEALDTWLTHAASSDRRRALIVLARDARRRLQILAPLRDAELWEDQRPEADAPPAPLPARVLPAMRAAPPSAVPASAGTDVGR